MMANEQLEHNKRVAELITKMSRCRQEHHFSDSCGGRKQVCANCPFVKKRIELCNESDHTDWGIIRGLLPDDVLKEMHMDKTPPEKMPIFDKRKEVDEEIYPLMQQVKAICKRLDIPMIFAVLAVNDGEQVGVTQCACKPSYRAPFEFVRAQQILKGKSMDITVIALIPDEPNPGENTGKN